jgi:hypothetical protein
VQSIKIPSQIKDKFKIVHPELVKNERFQKFVKKLNEERYYYNPPEKRVIQDLAEVDIKDAIKNQETIELNEEKWKNLTENEKIEKIKHLKDSWYATKLSLDEYNFLQLKSKNGKWLDPESLIFSNEFKPEHNVELLAGKKLIDSSLKFISPVFIEGNDDDEIRKWRRFLEQLGVDKALKTRKEGGKKELIVQQIGVKVTLKFESSNQRSARVLGEHEKPGYDIVSKSKDETRYIEVKSTSENSYDIFLTVNEFRALKDIAKTDKYFVYVVLNALRTPILYVARGTILLEIEDIKVDIPFNKWSIEAKEDEYQP